MPSIQYSIKYGKNELVVSPDELLSSYMYGINIKSQDGSSISSDTIKFKIKAAQQEVEKFLEIRLQPKFIEHTVDYFRDDYWNKFPIIKTKLPVKKPLSLIGFLNGIEQIRYPVDWVNVKKDNEGFYPKKLHLIPTGSILGNSGAVILSGITAYFGLTAYSDIPNYFNLQYVTGFDTDTFPYDVIDLVGKLATVQLLYILGDIVLGQPGLTSVSLSLDGLSQSNSIASPTAFSARIKGYLEDIKHHTETLKGIYRSFNFASL